MNTWLSDLKGELTHISDRNYAEAVLKLIGDRFQYQADNEGGELYICGPRNIWCKNIDYIKNEIQEALQKYMQGKINDFNKEKKVFDKKIKKMAQSAILDELHKEYTKIDFLMYGNRYINTCQNNNRVKK